MRTNITPFMIGLTALAFSGLAIAQAVGENQPKATHEPAAHFAQDLAACGITCETCAHHCGAKVAEGKKEHAKTQQFCQDCAAICHAAAAISARQGPLQDAILTACVEACKRCGEACAQGKDDPMMAHCAEACRKCEAMCREKLQQGSSK